MICIKRETVFYFVINFPTTEANKIYGYLNFINVNVWETYQKKYLRVSFLESPSTRLIDRDKTTQTLIWDKDKEDLIYEINEILDAKNN
jgi:hypothetical protein